MKKFLIVCLILFTASVGCKKMDGDGGGLCACSPVYGPPFYLVIKNNAGEDLLDAKTVGAYSKENIQLYRKDKSGSVIPIVFRVNLPFTYGNEKFNFNQLYVQELSFLEHPLSNIFYLKLGEGIPYEINYDLSKSADGTVFINKIQAEQEKSTIGKWSPIYHLTQPN